MEILITAGSVFVLVFILLAWMYNRMVKNKNRIEEAWSVIDVFLKKRHELIPAVLEVVKSYASYEKTLLGDVSRLRSEAVNASDRNGKLQSETELGKALSQLFVVVEGYPVLKADTHFLELQHQLSEMETDLERARRYYNGTVREYNIFLQVFPMNLVAGLFGFQPARFFAFQAD